jgi:hypothetical protein
MDGFTLSYIDALGMLGTATGVVLVQEFQDADADDNQTKSHGQFEGSDQPRRSLCRSLRKRSFTPKLQLRGGDLAISPKCRHP